jgi:hypothetical protein
MLKGPNNGNVKSTTSFSALVRPVNRHPSIKFWSDSNHFWTLNSFEYKNYCCSVIRIYSNWLFNLKKKTCPTCKHPKFSAQVPQFVQFARSATGRRTVCWCPTPWIVMIGSGAAD